MSELLATRRFLLTVGLCLGCLMAMGAAAVAIDPYLLFDAPRVEGLNRWKTRFFFAQYRSKPRHVENFAARHLIIGTSTGGSMRPDHPLFGGARAFNYSLAGSTPQTQYVALQHATRSNPLESVILGVDFFAYNANLQNRQFQQYMEAVQEPRTMAELPRLLMPSTT